MDVKSNDDDTDDIKEPLTPKDTLSTPAPAITLPRLLDTLSKHLIEPQCGDPTFIMHHPAIMSPLAKSFVDPRSGQTVSARAELFVRGREYVNCYEEENSPFEQRRKFEQQMLLRKGGNITNPNDNNNNTNANTTTEDPSRSRTATDPKAPASWSSRFSSQTSSTTRKRKSLSTNPSTKIPLDEENYLEALEWALPPTGGWGAGVDRLVMLFSGQNRIANVLPFGTLRNVVGLHVGKRRVAGAAGARGATGATGAADATMKDKGLEE